MNQYTFDDLKTQNSDNTISGYSWFKSNVMFSPLNQYTGKQFLSSSYVSPELASVTVFPNPGQGIVSFSNWNDSYEVAILTQIGQEVMPKQRINGNRVDISAFDPGLYFVIVFSGNQYNTFRYSKYE